MSLTIRSAVPLDLVTIREFIFALAEYEKMLSEVQVTEEQLREAIFEEALIDVVIAEWDGQAVGFALFYENFSTFVGKKGLYLEDLFVYPEFRGKGIGSALLNYLAALAVQRNCGRFEWACLDWNQPSLDFYKSIGAERKDEWIIHRVTGEALNKLAKQGEPFLQES